MMKINKYLIIMMVGIILLVSTTATTLLQSVGFITVRTSSPVKEGEICVIDIIIQAGVGVSGTANLYIDNVFYTGIGGTGGSDGNIYSSTGWKTEGVGNHTLRVVFFEEGNPQSYEASVIITVTDGDGVIPPVSEFPVILGMQIAGVALTGLGGYKYFIERKRR